MTNSVKSVHDVTQDTVFDGRIAVCQPRRGYRFSVDALLLTWFSVSNRPDGTCADLGAGCGVIGIGLLTAVQVQHVTAVEVQPDLADLCVSNARLNGCDAQYRVLNIDIRNILDHLPPECVDLVVSNPPFWSSRSGRLSEDEQRKIACHEVLGTLDDWTTAASRLITRRGRVCLVYPARRLDELLSALNRSGLGSTRLRLVHPMPNSPAELALVEARKGKPGRLTVVAPLVLKHESGADTDEARAIYSGAFSAALRARPDTRSNTTDPVS